MDLTGSPTTTMVLDDVRVPFERRIGAEGQGLSIALAGLAKGRMGMAAAATGIAQAALDLSVEYARERDTFGQPIIEHQGVGFLLADWRRVESVRHLPDGGPPSRRRAVLRSGGVDRQAGRH